MVLSMTLRSTTPGALHACHRVSQVLGRSKATAKVTCYCIGKTPGLLGGQLVALLFGRVVTLLGDQADHAAEPHCNSYASYHNNAVTQVSPLGCFSHFAFLVLNQGGAALEE